VRARDRRVPDGIVRIAALTTRTAGLAMTSIATRDIAGWRLRFSGGYTKRANSINALTPDAQVDGGTLDALEAAYKERHQRPAWRLTPLAPPLYVKPQSCEALVLSSSIIWLPLQASSFWQKMYTPGRNFT